MITAGKWVKGKWALTSMGWPEQAVETEGVEQFT